MMPQPGTHSVHGDRGGSGMQQAFADLLLPFLFHCIMNNEWWFDDYALAIRVAVQSTSEMASKIASEMGRRRYPIC